MKMELFNNQKINAGHWKTLQAIYVHALADLQLVYTWCLEIPPNYFI